MEISRNTGLIFQPLGTMFCSEHWLLRRLANVLGDCESDVQQCNSTDLRNAIVVLVFQIAGSRSIPFRRSRTGEWRDEPVWVLCPNDNASRSDAYIVSGFRCVFKSNSQSDIPINFLSLY